MDDDIRNWLRDEDYITFLAKRRKGDQLPQGVVADNPFSSNPWDYPEDSWYVFEESLTEDIWEGCVRRTENGFWKWSSSVTIPTESIVGFRNVFEFYQGSTPVGTRTGWMMHRYHAGPNSEVACDAQDDTSLCRLFWNNVEKGHSSQPNNSPAACADIHTLGSDIIVRKGEREDPSRREADGTVFINDCYGDFIEMKDLMSPDLEPHELYNDLSDGSYFEFDDLGTSDSASTSSGDSSNLSGNCDEYFNIDEMLGEIETGAPAPNCDEYFNLDELLGEIARGAPAPNCDEYFNIDKLLGEIARGAPAPMEDEGKADCLSNFTGPVQTDGDVQLKAIISPDKVNYKLWNNLSGEDYLELRELLPSNRASTASGNLGCESSSPGDFYFNADELLSNIARDCSASVKEDQENPNGEFCIKNYTLSESVASCIGNIEVADDIEQSRSLEGPLTSGCSRTCQVKRNRSVDVTNRSNSHNSSDSDSSASSGSESSGNNSSKGCSSSDSTSKTPQSRRRNPGKRLAKLGKFFCFP